LRTIAFYSLKGGVGKTAAAVNIAYLASQAGVSTLLWDLDPQGASSWYLAGADRIKGHKLSELMKGKTPIAEFIHESDYPRLDFIPSHTSFRNLDVKLDQEADENLIKQWLAPLSEETSLVILDCPPSLSRLSEQVLPPQEPAPGTGGQPGSASAPGPEIHHPQCQCGGENGRERHTGTEAGPGFCCGGCLPASVEGNPEPALNPPI